MYQYVFSSLTSCQTNHSHTNIREKPLTTVRFQNGDVFRQSVVCSCVHERRLTL